jgi:hypothetical protein
MLSTAGSKECWAQETDMQGGGSTLLNFRETHVLSFAILRLRNTPTEYMLPQYCVSKLLNILETKNFIFGATQPIINHTITFFTFSFWYV